MNRRNFIYTSGFSLASVLIGRSLLSCKPPKEGFLINLPDTISAVLSEKLVTLTRNGDKWNQQQLEVRVEQTVAGLAVYIQCPGAAVSSVSLNWKTPAGNSSRIMNDNWERTYGESSWHKPNEAEILPWYFLEQTSDGVNGFGIKTGAASFCFWSIGKDSLTLTLDTRSGGAGVLLGSRELKAAEIVTRRGSDHEQAFAAGQKFASVMCEKARMPKAPVYGINDWYFSYGNNSADLIMEHTNLIAPLTEGLTNRPFSVIDAGWFQPAVELPEDRSWGAVDQPNSFFGDMASLAEKINKAGMKPGLWTRPLCGNAKSNPALMLPINESRGKNSPVLDPSIPDNIETIKNYFKVYKTWGYDLVKFDYTSFDVFGKWGFQMLKDKSIESSGWRMHDQSRTNAEIILNLYTEIREASGDLYIIGCNTFSHLSAGLFELNRIGDDTSGNQWERTKKMGVNTLAFRGIQHGTFYSADADCVGLTTKISWKKNRQWMDLLAKSGTPLFISAEPEAIGAEQKEMIKSSFRLASKNIAVGEPLDWVENQFPEKWKLNGEVTEFKW